MFYCTLMEQFYWVQLYGLITAHDWIDLCGAWRSHSLGQHVLPCVWLNSAGVVGRNAPLQHNTLKGPLSTGPRLHHSRELPPALTVFISSVQSFVSSRFTFFFEVSNIILIAPNKYEPIKTWGFKETPKVATPTAVDSLMSAQSTLVRSRKAFRSPLLCS